MNMTLLLMKSGFGSFDEIVNFPTHKYLFLGEMVNRRQIVENLK